MHFQAEQLHGGLGALGFPFLLAQRLPFARRQATPASRSDARPMIHKPALSPGLQQLGVRLLTNNATVQLLDVQRHQRLPAGMWRRPRIICCRKLRRFDPCRRSEPAEGMADGRWQFVEPGARDFLELQVVQASPGRQVLAVHAHPALPLADRMRAPKVHQTSARGPNSTAVRGWGRGGAGLRGGAWERQRK